jgi:hypothetical protein
MNPLTQMNTKSSFGSTASFDPQAGVKAELGRLIHAAIINQRFRQKLLTNPVNSIEDGYCGEKFHFPTEFKERLQSIKAESIESFSLQLMQILNAPRISEKAVLNFQ